MTIPINDDTPTATAGTSPVVPLPPGDTPRPRQTVVRGPVVVAVFFSLIFVFLTTMIILFATFIVKPTEAWHNDPTPRLPPPGTSTAPPEPKP